MNRLALVIASMALSGAALTPNLKADEWNKMTVLTANEPIQIPNKVLQPGTYVFKLMDSPSDRHIVQVFDRTQQHLVTTVLAIPNYRLEPTGKTVFTFWETPPGQPKALRAWFYPGDNFGQEFLYSKLMTVSTASTLSTTAAVAPPAPPETEPTVTAPPVTAPAKQVEEKPAEEPQQIAQASPPPAPPEQAAPSPTPSTTPDTLPHTASPVPLIGLAGFLSLGAFATLRLARTS